MRTLEQIRANVLADVTGYYKERQEAMPYLFLSQRYGRGCLKHGIELREVLEQDERYVVRTNKVGRRLVATIADLEKLSEFGPNAQFNFWKAHGVSV